MQAEEGKKKRNHVSPRNTVVSGRPYTRLETPILVRGNDFLAEKMVEKLGNTDRHGSTELHDIYLILYKKTKIRLSYSG